MPAQLTEPAHQVFESYLPSSGIGDLLDAAESGGRWVGRANTNMDPQNDGPNLNDFKQSRIPSESEPNPFDQSPAWQPEEIPLGDGRVLNLEDS